MKHHLRVVVALSVFQLVSLAAAQVPDQFSNLKVLPKDISKAELVETMKGFTRALGVRCSNCHRGEEGQPLTSYDFASDERRMKQNARIMLQMVHEINAKSVSRVQLEAGARPLTVTCYTCHRGKKEPKTKAPMPAPPAPAPAPPKPTT